MEFDKVRSSRGVSAPLVVESLFGRVAKSYPLFDVDVSLVVELLCFISGLLWMYLNPTVAEFYL